MSISRLKTLSKDILYYGVSNMLYSLMQLITMPVIIREMSMSEVASWNILLPTGVLLSAIVTFGMDSALVRFVLDEEESKKKIIYSTGLYFVMGFALFVSLCLGIFSQQTAKIINLSEDSISSYVVLLCWLPGTILAQYSQNWLKYTFQRSRFIQVLALQSAFYLISILYLKLSHQIDLHAVMLASVGSVWISALCGLFFTQKMIKLTVDTSLLSRLLRYGCPFMILAFGFNMLFSFDKYILSGSMNKEDFAVYSQAFRIAAVFSMIVSSFNFAFGPFSLSLLHKEDAPDSFAYLRTTYLLFMTLAGLAFTAVSKMLISLLAGRNYLEGHKYIPFFVGGYILYGLYSFAQLGIIHSKKSYLGLYVLLCGMAIMIGLDLLLIPYIHGYGTALGFVFGNLTMVVIANYVSGKYYMIHTNKLKDILLLGSCLIAGVGMPVFVDIHNIYIDGLLKLLVSSLVVIAVLLSAPFETERSLFRQALSKLNRS